MLLRMAKEVRGGLVECRRSRVARGLGYEAAVYVTENIITLDFMISVLCLFRFLDFIN